MPALSRKPDVIDEYVVNGLLLLGYGAPQTIFYRPRRRMASKEWAETLTSDLHGSL
jgi:hypothetical protein